GNMQVFAGGNMRRERGAQPARGDMAGGAAFIADTGAGPSARIGGIGNEAEAGGGGDEAGGGVVEKQAVVGREAECGELGGSGQIGQGDEGAAVDLGEGQGYGSGAAVENFERVAPPPRPSPQGGGCWAGFWRKIEPHPRCSTSPLAGEVGRGEWHTLCRKQIR